MKVFNRFLLIVAVLVPLSSPVVLAVGEDVSPEATEEIRIVAAKDMLSKEPDTVVLYAKGLCCHSCGIGVRKMISRLDFVDRKRFNKGVELDTKTQLVVVAIAESEMPDLESLSEAIVDAGYDPVRSYRLTDGNLQTDSLVSGS